MSPYLSLAAVSRLPIFAPHESRTTSVQGSRATPRSRRPNRELIRNEAHGEVRVLQAIVFDGHDAEA